MPKRCTPCVLLFFSLVTPTRSCAFRLEGDPNGGYLVDWLSASAYVDSGEVSNGRPIFVHAEDPLRVFQWEGDRWDMCERLLTTGPSTCTIAGGILPRSGYISTSVEMPHGVVTQLCGALCYVYAQPCASSTTSSSTDTTMVTTTTAQTSTTTTSVVGSSLSTDLQGVRTSMVSYATTTAAQTTATTSIVGSSQSTVLLGVGTSMVSDATTTGARTQTMSTQTMTTSLTSSSRGTTSFETSVTTWRISTTTPLGSPSIWTSDALWSTSHSAPDTFTASAGSGSASTTTGLSAASTTVTGSIGDGTTDGVATSLGSGISDGVATSEGAPASLTSSTTGTTGTSNSLSPSSATLTVAASAGVQTATTTGREQAPRSSGSHATTAAFSAGSSIHQDARTSLRGQKSTEPWTATASSLSTTAPEVSSAGLGATSSSSLPQSVSAASLLGTASSAWTGSSGLPEPAVPGAGSTSLSATVTPMRAAASTTRRTFWAGPAEPHFELGNITEGVREAGMAAVRALQGGALSAVLQSRAGTAHAYALRASPAPGAWFAGDEASGVLLPRAILQGGSADVVVITKLSSLAMGGEDLVRAAAEAGRDLASPAIDVSLYSARGRYVAVASARLLLRLSSAAAHNMECSFWDAAAVPPRWSRRGVRRARPEEVEAAGLEAAGTWCVTEHLTVFAALVEAGVLGCTNLELLSMAAMRALLEHEGWYAASAAVLVFCIGGGLLLLFAAGSLRECHSLRLGMAHGDDSGPAYCCRTFCTFGLELLKHKYTAFLVFARDVLRCLRMGHHHLRLSSLVAAVQRFLSVGTGISTACIAQHCWNGNGWVESRAPLPRAVLCRKLEFHAWAVEATVSRLCGPGALAAAKRLLLTFLAIHPLLDAARLGAGSMTVGKRVTLQAAGLFGVMATNALIFNFSGTLRSWESPAQCPIEPSSFAFLCVATAVSVTVNAVPNAMLLDIAKQAYAWPLLNALFWLLTLSYLLTANLLVLVALANLNPRDSATWYAALEFAMAVKLLGLPAAQALRHWLLLELFLREGLRSAPEQRLPVLVGLQHPCEEELSAEDEAMVEAWTERAISASELLKFYALLGERVMPGFDAETSTSWDVLQHAVLPLTADGADIMSSLEDLIVKVEVVEALGLAPATSAPLCCNVLHLAEQLGQERRCISEQPSQPAEVWPDCSCTWAFHAKVLGLGPEHALGFLVTEGGRGLGLACLPAEEVFNARAGLWSGELQLIPVDQGPFVKQAAFSAPPRVPLVLSRAVAGSKGQRLGSKERRSSARRPARLWVKVQLPVGYKRALAMLERARLEAHEGEEVTAAHLHAYQTETSTMAVARDHSYIQGGGPAPYRVVTHSPQALFSETVAAVLVDALGAADSSGSVHDLLRARAFQDLLAKLMSAGCHRARYWMDMFAIDYQRLQQAPQDQRDRVLACLPATLRGLRQAACRRAVADIEAGRGTLAGPLVQLLVLDRSFTLLEEPACLSELMLAKAMGVPQRLALQPCHFKGRGLGQALKRFSKQEDIDWPECSMRILEDRTEVFEALRSLAVLSVQRQRLQRQDSWDEFDMADLLVAVGVTEVARERQVSEQGGGMDDFADVDAT